MSERKLFADFGAAMFVILLVLLFFLGWFKDIRADERTPWQPIIVGAGLMTAPLAFTDKKLDWGHAIELEGWSYAATDIFGRVVGKKNWFMAPLFVAMVDGLYRAGEKDGAQKLCVDYFGILGRTAIEIDWGL